VLALAHSILGLPQKQTCNYKRTDHSQNRGANHIRKIMR